MLLAWCFSAASQSESGRIKRARSARRLNKPRPPIHGCRFEGCSAPGKGTYPPQPKNPKGEVHEDTGFISYDKAAKKLVLRQFHVEGFVNHYVLDSVSEDGRRVVFVTVAIENIPAGWRGRETYDFVNDNEFVETFALAEPGKDFATYSETHFRRKR